MFITGFLVYANSINNGFVWDDEEQIVKNSIIQSLGNIGQIFSGATFQTGGADLSGYFFRPLITFTFMINFFFWGENAFGFHLFQIIFHIVNASLLYRILLLLTQANKHQKTAGLILALLYLVHPAINEGVVYISAVSEVMFTFFILSAFYKLLSYQNQKPGIKQALTASALLFAAMLYKESAVVGPPILVAYLFIYQSKYRIKWSLILSGLFLFYFFIRLVVIQTPLQHPQFSNISEASLAQRLMTIPYELFHYLKITAYPKDLAISQHFVVTTPNLANFYLPLTVIILLFFLALITGIKSGSKLVIFGLSWLIISFSPILSIIPLDMTIAERWYYFPFIGLILILAGFMQNLRPNLGQLVAIASLCTIPFLSARTIIRNANWVDGLTLYSHDIQISKDSFDLENNLGVELFRAGRIPEAKEHFQNSIALQPKWHFALNNLGAVYQNEKNYPEAKKLYLKVLENSDYYLAYENLSSIYLVEGNYKLARDFTEDSLKKLPNNSVLWLNLAIAEYKLGNKSNALEAAKNAYMLNPGEQTGYVYSQLSQERELKFE